MSEKTDGTESALAGKFAFMLERLKNASPEQTRLDLIRAGIITPDGELTPHYTRGVRTKKKKKPAAE